MVNRAVLIIGVTGFVGAFLLYQMVVSSVSNDSGGNDVGGKWSSMLSKKGSEFQDDGQDSKDARISELEAEVASLKSELLELDQEISNKAADANQPELSEAKSSSSSSSKKSSTVKEPSSRETTVRCVMLGAYQDVCVYENLCFSSHESLVLISEKPRRIDSSDWRTGGIKFTTKLPLLPAQDRPNRIKPAQYKAKSVNQIRPDDLDKADKAKKVLWTPDNKVLFVPSYQESLSNIWYFSTKILPMYTMQFYRELYDIPDLREGVVVMPPQGRREKIHMNWHDAMLNLTIPEGVKVHFAEDEPYGGLDPGKSGHQYICTKQAVLYGAAVYGFPDWMTAHRFRELAFRTNGVKLPGRPPFTVTILDRKSYKPRHIANLIAVKEMVREFVEPKHVIWDASTTFKQQLEVLAETGVLLTVHGAGLMNEIFLPPGAVVIEIFPPHVKHVLYERLSHNSGVYHFKVYATEFTDNFHTKYNKYFDHKCDTFPSLDVPEISDCWGLMKNPSVVAPIEDLRTALMNALDFVSTTPIPKYKLND